MDGNYWQRVAIIIIIIIIIMIVGIRAKNCILALRPWPRMLIDLRTNKQL